MITNIISIGNSKGIRIPKVLLEESGLRGKVELKVKKGEIKLVIVPTKEEAVGDVMMLSENALEVDWNKPGEEEAWKSLE